MGRMYSNWASSKVHLGIFCLLDFARKSTWILRVSQIRFFHRHNQFEFDPR